MAEISATAPKPATPLAAGAQASQAPNPAKNSDPSKQVAGTKPISTASFSIQLNHERQRWLKLLVYGRHGGGKTELASSAVDCLPMRDVLVIDAEKGDSTIEDTPRVKNPHLIHNIQVTNFKQVGKIHEFLTAYCRARDRKDVAAMKRLFCQVTGLTPEQVPDDKVPNYQTVIIDSLTEVETYCTYGILNIDSQVIVTDDIDTAGWPEFRKNLEMMKLLVRAFRDLPMHVIFCCAESWSQDEHKKYHYQPKLTGQLSSAVQGFVDIVGWLTVGAASADQPEAPRRMYIQPISGGPKFDAKNRRPVFKGAYFDNPSMTSIMRDTGFIRPDEQE